MQIATLLLRPSMKLTNLEKTHRLKINDLKYLGGKYSFFQSIKKGGVGSPQFLYKDGIDKWDKMDGEFQYKSVCSIELHKKGIALWYNKRQKIHAALIPYEEVIAINYHSFKVDAQPLYQTKYILEAGNLDIQLKESDTPVSFYVPAPKHKTLVKFLNKHFSAIFNHDKSQDEPILSEDPLYTSIYLHGVNY